MYIKNETWIDFRLFVDYLCIVALDVSTNNFDVKRYGHVITSLFLVEVFYSLK